MRILVAIAHFFRAEENSRHTSTDARRREQRAQIIRSVITTYRGQFGPTQVIDVATRRFVPVLASVDTLDIVLLTDRDNHLVPADEAARLGASLIDAKPADPRRLGFAAHRLMADLRDAYDLFCFSEDDLRVSDPSFFDKILGFTEAFGPRRILVPNRFEWNPRAQRLKTFIDGDLRRGLIEPYEAALPDVPTLEQPALGRTIKHRRPGNPHAGFFAITGAQLKHWIAQPHFGDEDCRFIGPLESAATLGMLKTFPIYKSYGRNMAWLQIEHMDNRFSSLKLEGWSGG
ncbi:hypothetical protein [Plastoroseomonas arctica]|uniref:Uncharacterized protein n=1 Tax=Plastoroseomonas arctica TaxID=1509237 RepID=A0AAF1KLP5_9PROT|nr:hypothetical protein [Plastoroseomonas arctica]MBR0654986.1 hypothetical protein [Plastoroseomonas arctica]